MVHDRFAGHRHAALSRAIHEENRHFLAVVDGDIGAGRKGERAQAIMDECAAAMFGAAVGEAKRLVRERGEGVGAEVHRLASVADAIENGLTHPLYLAWRIHFVDGRALCEYARVAGLSMTTAIANYRELVGVLVTTGEL